MRTTWPYDMWSVGVVWLELLFATPHVFSVSERTRVLLEQALHLEQMSEVSVLQVPAHREGSSSWACNSRSTAVTARC